MIESIFPTKAELFPIDTEVSKKELKKKYVLNFSCGSYKTYCHDCGCFEYGCDITEEFNTDVLCEECVCSGLGNLDPHTGKRIYRRKECGEKH